MNKKIFNLLWKTRIKACKVRRDMYILTGNAEGANKEYVKVLKMMNAYKEQYLDKAC